MAPNRDKGLFALLLPGLLVAATGVGAGDLASAGFAGTKLGTAILWAVLVGAFFKFVMNEGLARWQLATGDTLLEGASRHLGTPFRMLFLGYLLVWSVLVGAALMAACGVTAETALDLFDHDPHGKIVFGIAHSALGVGLVLAGGFRLFEKVMSACIALMFVTVLVTAVLIGPDWGAVVRGLAVPVIPRLRGEGLPWTMALLGGIGGTLTVLCYGYWIRESGRKGSGDLRLCRIDLAVGYAMTALFGVAMVVIGSRIEVDGRGSKLVANLALALEEPLGPVGKWTFLVGAWGAVFSSLLGVWQAVPYLFADFMRFGRSRPGADPGDRPLSDTPPYRMYLAFLALAPIPVLWLDFSKIAKFYGVFGACFMPFLAAMLLFLNGRARWVGRDHRNHPATSALLVLILGFFAWALYQKAAG